MRCSGVSSPLLLSSPSQPVALISDMDGRIRRIHIAVKAHNYPRWHCNSPRRRCDLRSTLGSGQQGTQLSTAQRGTKVIAVVSNAIYTPGTIKDEADAKGKSGCKPGYRGRAHGGGGSLTSLVSLASSTSGSDRRKGSRHGIIRSASAVQEANHTP